MLGGLYIGSRYYWPDGYVEVGRPYCSGITPDGCTLRWQDVELEGGGTVAQCVQLCPRVDVTPPLPPPAIAEPVPPPPAEPALPAEDACVVSIFAEPNFGGTTEETDENQPDLGEWDKAIASVEVTAGTWDFFTEPDFKGEVMRLTPGKYGDLGEKFTKQVGSFMCIDK